MRVTYFAQELRRIGRLVGHMCSLVLAFFIAFLWLSTQPTHGLEPRCFSVQQLMTTELLRFGSKEWLAHQLKREGEVWHLIFTAKVQDNTSNLRNWLLATRLSQDRPDTYCIEGTGSQVEVLFSLHDMNFIDKFGMHGSGNPRCGNPNDPLEGMKVRGWASKELGNSLILSFNEPTFNDPSFVLLMSKTDDFWILLNKPHGEATCYRDRGQIHDMRDIRLK